MGKESAAAAAAKNEAARQAGMARARASEALLLKQRLDAFLLEKEQKKGK